MNTAKRQFIFALDQARLTGILLGLYLAKSNFAQDRAVTTIGYSLGGVVSFNMMRIINRFTKIGTETIEKRKYAARVLCDVNLWAGAYVIDVTKKYDEKVEKAGDCIVVNGNLNNVWSKNDAVLKHGFTMLYKNQKCVGLYPIFEDIEEKDKASVKPCSNYDASIECPFPGHSYYGPNCL